MWFIKMSKKPVNYLSFFLFLFSCGFLGAQTLEEITFLTEEYPPYNYTENGQLKGIAVDCLEWILRDLNTAITRDHFRSVPWTGGYQRVQNHPGTALFAMVRTPERESLFRWVGPIVKSTTSLIARRDSHIQIHTPEDVSGYTIGVVTNDIGEQRTKKILTKGALDAVTDPRLNARKLAHHRIDLWAYEFEVAQLVLQQEGFDPSLFEIVYTFTNNEEAYFAFHKDTSQQLIDQLQASLDKLRASDDYKKIIDRYQ